MVIVLSRGCKVVYANYSKIIVITKGKTKLTFKLRGDSLYYMKVNGSHKDEEEEKGN